MGLLLVTGRADMKVAYNSVTQRLHQVSVAGDGTLTDLGQIAMTADDGEQGGINLVDAEAAAPLGNGNVAADVAANLIAQGDRAGVVAVGAAATPAIVITDETAAETAGLIEAQAATAERVAIGAAAATPIVITDETAAETATAIEAQQAAATLVAVAAVEGVTPAEPVTAQTTSDAVKQKGVDDVAVEAGYGTEGQPASVVGPEIVDGATAYQAGVDLDQARGAYLAATGEEAGAELEIGDVVAGAYQFGGLEASGDDLNAAKAAYLTATGSAYEGDNTIAAIVVAAAAWNPA